MKKTVVLALLLAMAVPLLAQKAAKKAMTGDQKAMLLNMEKGLWAAFKDNNTKPFEEVMTANAIDLSGPVPTHRADFMKMLNSKQCTVNSYAIDDGSAQVVEAARDAAVLYYKVTEDASCGGQKAPSPVWASTVWVKQAGKWKAAFHQESPAGGQ